MTANDIIESDQNVTVSYQDTREVIERIDALAAAEDRSRSAELRVLIREALAARDR